MKTIKVGLLGIGNVGSGTYRALEMNSAAIEKSAVKPHYSLSWFMA